VEITLETGGRLDAVLAAALPELSRSRIADLIRQGHVTVDGDLPRRAAHKVRPGTLVRVDLPPPRPAEAVPQDLPLKVVYEDPDLIVVDKAAGMVVHPSLGHPDGTLVNALLHHVGDLSGIGGVERPGIVHRLDRGTSGLLVVAKHDHAHQALAAQFAAHTAGRTYLALCLGTPPDERGTCRSQLARHPTDRLRWASAAGKGKHAVTHWAVRGRAGSLALIECRLETGRTHQVRVHLTELGLPLVHDPVYKRRGFRLPAAVRALDLAADRPLLHAWRLRLVHPTSGEPCCFEAKPPGDFMECLAAVGIRLPEEPVLAG
jgi:23S rRNA pseudouridine1911/1915/1917 synthase